MKTSDIHNSNCNSNFRFRLRYSSFFEYRPNLLIVNIIIVVTINILDRKQLSDDTRFMGYMQLNKFKTLRHLHPDNWGTIQRQKWSEGPNKTWGLSVSLSIVGERIRDRTNKNRKGRFVIVTVFELCSCIQIMGYNWFVSVIFINVYRIFGEKIHVSTSTGKLSIEYKKGKYCTC